MTRVSVHDLSKHRETLRDGVVATIQDLFHRGKSVTRWLRRGERTPDRFSYEQ